MTRAPLLSLLLATGLLVGCGDDDTMEMTGRACEVVDDCFPDVNHEDLSGDVLCLDRVMDGYCTHRCTTDADCCAAEGECETGIRQVCAPFESTGEMLCFLACEADDIGDRDENDYCAEEAHETFICRSTGGGVMNRKVCVPDA